MIGRVAAEIVSDRPADLVAFYERVLCVPFRREAYGYRHPCWVSLGEPRQAVILQDARNLEPRQEPGRGRFLFYVPDLDVTEDRLRSAGAELVGERRNVGLVSVPLPGTREIWGRWLVTTRDPDGNVVSFRELTTRRRPVRERIADRAADIGRTVIDRLREVTVDAAAYALGRVRVRSRSLAGHTHVVASREGLFAVHRNGWSRLIAGAFFGLAVRDGELLALESYAAIDSNAPRGRLISIEHDGQRIRRTRVLRRGLPAGAHQIAFVGGKLHLVDTYGQRVLRLDEGFRDEAEFFPVEKAEAWKWHRGYVHMNSIAARDGEALLLLHNGLDSGRRSEIVRTDREFRVLERFEVPAAGAHDIICLEDGGLWVCDSRGGSIVDRDGPVVHVGSGMTRGLCVDATEVVVGDSLFTTRSRRRRVPGHVHFFDRDFGCRVTLELPAAPTVIRRIDGDDLAGEPGPRGAA
jgi:hypothetical protein